MESLPVYAVGLLAVFLLLVEVVLYHKSERSSEKDLYLAIMVSTLALTLCIVAGYKAFNAQNSSLIAIGLGVVLATCSGTISWYMDALYCDTHAVRFGATSLIDYYVTPEGILVAIQKAPNYEKPTSAKYKVFEVDRDFLSCVHIGFPHGTLAAAQKAVLEAYGPCKRLRDLGQFELWIQDTQYGTLISTERQNNQARKIKAQDVPQNTRVTVGAQAFLESYLRKSELAKFPAFND